MIRLNDKNEPIAVIKAGSRIFSDGRNPKDGSSLAVTRRNARAMRRRRDRLLKRKARMMRALIEYGFFPVDEVERKALELDGKFLPAAAKLGDALLFQGKAPIARKRSFVFSETADGNTFFINNRMYRESRVDTTAYLGDVEEWTLYNTSGELHVFHLHQVFQPDLAHVFHNRGAALIGEVLLNFVQLLDNQILQYTIRTQDFGVLRNAALDVGQFIQNLLPFHAGQALQLQLDAKSAHEAYRRPRCGPRLASTASVPVIPRACGRL